MEEIFYLTYLTSMTFNDAWNMPISKRKWLTNRAITQRNKENKQT